VNFSDFFFFTYWLFEATNGPVNTAARDSVVNSSSESGQNAVMTLLQYFSDCHAHTRTQTHTHTHTHTHVHTLRFCSVEIHHEHMFPPSKPAQIQPVFRGETVCNKLANLRWQYSCNSVGTSRKLRNTSVPQEIFLPVIVCDWCAERIPYRQP